MRIVILDELLSREMDGSNDGSSARVNSLKHVIKRNKMDMADDAPSSLDLMRRIFQAEISREIHQIMERHTRTTLLPAIENLRKNGHVVDESVLNGLYCNILEAAKKPYQKDPEPMPPICTNGNGFLDINSQEHENNLKRGYESDSSDVSGVSHCSDAKRRRGRPRKDEEAYRLEMTPPTMNEVIRWNPDRIDVNTRFITATKIAQVMGMPPSILFNKYPRMFRYSCDEDDKNILHEQNLLIRAPGRCYLLVAEDARQLVPSTYFQDVLNVSFLISEPLLSKIRQKAASTYEKYKVFLPTQPNNYL
ncbi:Suppressor of activated egl-4 protein 2 [Caenorhabditis elegans]|uniref:Suppressor of activated egl-4 protein 2 n=1 Tax=Caenorhabditis elegans TaxID=6239 RepID=SAEG2_CAEEL|nr:Suppressor of activated egl-4 protein 2 [Caenorhabditis elegans]Q03615.2 RecName: Full=Suppressor of activated egl-4 protein 2 [Caenorhabditis elegans]CAA79572.2 Suppressor of activated egl-4 protein 2 [Caenorhabditis elegans]|eukprot:NP_499042.2 Suppressor of activated egl-4 protein 2 [Caenorhabditis elegans]